MMRKEAGRRGEEEDWKGRQAQKQSTFTWRRLSYASEKSIDQQPHPTTPPSFSFSLTGSSVIKP